MPKYIGQSCTSCRSVFKDGDDIVVCPKCGSPYHRDCYKKEGSCINTELHESGESWQPEVTALEQPAAAENVVQRDAVSGKTQDEALVVCRRCGQTNDSKSGFCSRCGFPINSIEMPPNIQNIAFFGSQVKNDTDIDGNTAGEYVKYVGKSWYYYLPRFQQFKSGAKSSFNLSAFLFPELFFLYRKMIPMGIAMLALTTLLSFPSLIVRLYEFGSGATPSFLQQDWFLTLGIMASAIMMIIRVVSGMFANFLYYKKAKRDIEAIKREETDPAKRDMAMKSKGGTTLTYLLIALLLGTVSVYVAQILLNIKI